VKLLNRILDWINLDEFLTLVVLICLLVFTARQMARPDSLVYRQARRLAGATIVLYAALGIHAWGLSSARDLLVILIRALLAAGVVFGTSTIILAVVHQVVGDPLTAIASKYRQWTAEYRRRSAEGHAPHQTAETERHEPEERERQQAGDLAKCEDHRLECELLYSRHAAQLQGVLPPERFGALLDSYLSGQNDPQLVRKRTSMIKQMLTDQVSAVKTPDRARFESLQELAEHFATLRREAQQLPYDEDTRDSVLTALNKQEDAAIERFFERGAK